MTKQEPAVFVRESTGLVKNVSLLDAVSLNVSSMSAGAALATIAFTMFLIPTVLTSYGGINLVYGSIIAFVITIPQMIVYTIMTRRLPRTGGDYVWTSRAFGGFNGSTVSFMGYTVETMAFMALIAFSTVLAIGAVLVQLGQSQYLNLAIPINFGGSGIPQFALGATIYTLLILLNIFRPKYGYKLVSVTMIVGILSLLVGNAVLLLAGQSGVENYINGLGISGTTYQSVAASYQGSSFDFGNTIFMMPFFAMFVYPWFVAGPAVAAEIKGKRSTNWNVPISALIALLLVTGTFATMYYVAGYSFTNGAFFNSSLVNDYSFNFWTLAMGVSSSSVLAAFIGLGWILWNVGILAYGIIGISRYIFAQSFDRFLPEKMSYVSPRFRSPVVAHVIDLVVTVAILGVAVGAYGYINSLYGAIMASMIYFIFVGGAAVLYAIRNEKGGIKTLLAAAGLMSACIFGFLTYQFLAYPGVWGGNTFAYGYILASVILGALIYVVSRKYHMKKGIDISLAYKEIPPE